MEKMVDKCRNEAFGFIKGKRVFLTGHTGFKGTWLSLMLEKLGAETYGYAKDSENPFFRQAHPHLCKSTEGDIADKEKVLKALNEAQPEIVIHFASHSTLTKSYEITDYIFNTNVQGVVNLLEAVRKTSSVRAVLIVTSDKCYRNLESDVPYTEDSVLGAADPYSASKACQELVSECYRKSFFSAPDVNVSIATARASNVLGGGDFNLDRLLPGLMDSFVHGKEAVIRKPDSIRPWQSVFDVLGGYLMLIKHMLEADDAKSIYCSAYNFGPEESGIITVKELAEKLVSNFENASFKVSDTGEKVKETKVLKISSDKSKKELGWKPVYTIDEAVQGAALFEKRRYNGEDVRHIASDLIEDYLKRF